jgi:hypothetical protein
MIEYRSSSYCTGGMSWTPEHVRKRESRFFRNVIQQPTKNI